jgi:hypothetical protein
LGTVFTGCAFFVGIAVPVNQACNPPGRGARARSSVPDAIEFEAIGGDDAADALRYLVATKMREIRVAKLRGL